MATSGTLYTNYVSYNGGSYTLTTRLKITWTRTSAPVSENASYITVTGVMESNMSSGYVRGYRSQTLTINGQTALYEAYKSTGTNYGGGETVFQVTNFKIPHNDDGTKTFTMSYEAYVGSTSANQWINNQPVSITLDSIARASSFTLTSSSIYSNGTIGMSISRASTSFTHDISISYGSTSASLGTGIGTSLSVAVPAAIKTAMKNANSASASCTITVTTKNGSTAIGSKTGTISISAPNATVSTSVASVAVNSATAQWSLGNADTGLCTYTVTRSLGSIVYTDQTKTTTTSKNNGANANFLQSTTNAKSGTVTTQVTTFVGSTQVGTNSTTYTVTIPSSYGPSISLTSGYPKKYSDTASYQNLYLAGYSGVQWKATGAVGSGSYASISSLTAEIISGYGTLSNSVSGSTITSSLSKLTASSSNYTEKVRLTVTDSRGYTAYVDSSVSVSGYYLPVFDMENTWAKRATSSGVLDNEGTYANLSAKATTHSNAYITSLVIKTGSTTIKTVSNTSASTKTLTATQNAYGTYATTSEGSFSATATDIMGKTSTVSFILPKAAVHLSLYEGNPGVGLGTVAEVGYITNGLPMKLKTPVTLTHTGDVAGSTSFNGYSNMSESLFIPYCIAARNNSNTTYAYHRIATVGEITSSWFDASAVLLLDQGYEGGGFGIARIVARTNNVSNGNAPSFYAHWLARTSNLPANSIQFGVKNNSGKLTVDVYYYATGTYSSVVVRKLESARASALSSRWTLINSTAAGNGASGTNTTNTEVYTGINRISYTSTGTASEEGYIASAGRATSATSATNATNYNVTVNNPTSGTWFRPIFTANSSGNMAGYNNNGFMYFTQEGTASVQGYAYIRVGNEVASGTAGNKRGILRLYSNSAYYSDFYTADGQTTNHTIKLPDANGTLTVNAVTTATGVVAKSSGGATLKSSTINIFGKVAQLNVVITGPSGSQTDGTKIFVGTISNAAYRPKASARGCDTYGTSALIGWITTGGEVNIRVMDAGTYNTELEMAFTYIIP